MPSTSDLTCKEIIEEILKGGVARERMTQRVFKEYKGFLISIAKKLGVPYDIAADAYAEAVTELVIKIPTGKFVPKFPRSCSTFIYTVCYNKCVDHKRREQNKPDMEYIEDSENPYKYEPLPERKRLRWKDILTSYEEKIGKKCKDILELHIEGFKPKEIAEKLGMASANSVSATKSKCIKDLKKLIDEEGVDDIF